MVVFLMKIYDVIYELKGVQFVDIYITLHYIIHYITLHYIRSSLAVCVCMVVFLMKQKVVLILYRVHVRHCVDPNKASTEPSLW